MNYRNTILYTLVTIVIINMQSLTAMQVEFDFKPSQKINALVGVEKNVYDLVTIVMPDEQTLREIFLTKGLIFITENTKLCSLLAGENFPAGIDIAIQLTLDRYEQDLKTYYNINNLPDIEQRREALGQTINEVVNEILSTNPSAKAFVQETRNHTPPPSQLFHRKSKRLHING